jgi:hypothetical protein
MHHHRQREVAIHEHTLDNCSNEGGCAEIFLPANETTPEPYHCAKQHWVLELDTCGIYKIFDEKREL